MSDVSYAKAGWLGVPILLLMWAILWIRGKQPVLLSLAEYERLKDNDYIMDDAHRAIVENRRLRAKYEPEPDAI